MQNWNSSSVLGAGKPNVDRACLLNRMVPGRCEGQGAVERVEVSGCSNLLRWLLELLKVGVCASKQGREARRRRHDSCAVLEQYQPLKQTPDISATAE